MDKPIAEILNAYNPLEIKDILLNGARRKATKHKNWDAVLSYYQEWQPYIHHYLLDSPEVWDDYAIMQKAYTHDRSYYGRSERVHQRRVLSIL